MPPTLPTLGSIQDKHAKPGLDRTRVPASFRGAGWLELFASLLAIAGVLASVLSGYHAREWQASASDFKTLYASAQCFRHHVDPFDFRNIAAVFQSNHVVPPVSWYAHAPVYPPFTLAVLTPLTALSMVPAIYTWMALTGIALAFAAFSLAYAAGDLFGLTLPWRLALIALFAAYPSLSFSLEMGNVSAIVAALCITAVVLSQTSENLRIVPPIALAAALLLKPHLAFWVLLALFLSRVPKSRRLATTSVTLFACALLAIGLWMAIQHQLAPEIASYRAVVQQEVAGGSMDPKSMNTVAVAAQITSLATLLGYWLTGLPLTMANAALLTALLGTLIYSSLNTNTNENHTTLLRVGAWSAFGLLATYHRAHDSLVLLVLLPWLLWCLQKQAKNLAAWLLIGLLFCIGTGPSVETYLWLATRHGLNHIATFLLFRQAAFVATIFMLVLTPMTLRQTSKEKAVVPQ